MSRKLRVPVYKSSSWHERQEEWLDLECHRMLKGGKITALPSSDKVVRGKGWHVDVNGVREANPSGPPLGVHYCPDCNIYIYVSPKGSRACPICGHYFG